MTAPFRHHDRERTIVFGRGTLARVGEFLPKRFTLLSTERALAAAEHVAESAETVVIVPAGQVNELAAALRDRPVEGTLVALGGGRVVDTAKAIAAADGGRPVIAIPTSLSAAEMTGIHRHALGVDERTPRVRPGTVLNDPELSASQPERQLAASTANALGHAIAAHAANRSDPIAKAVAGEAVDRLTGAWSGEEPDRDELALGALLAGWAVDHSGLGPHHALAQTAVREASLGHAQTNAALLPFTVAELRKRHPENLAVLDAKIGRRLETAAEEIRQRAGNPNLQALTDDPSLLRRTVEAAAGRPELHKAAPAFSRDEIEAMYRSAVAASS